MAVGVGKRTAAQQRTRYTAASWPGVEGRATVDEGGQYSFAVPLWASLIVGKRPRRRCQTARRKERRGSQLGGFATAADGKSKGAYRRGGPTICMWCPAISFWFVSASTPCRSANIFS